MTTAAKRKGKGFLSVGAIAEQQLAPELAQERIQPQQGLALSPELALIERLVLDPNVDVGKLEKLMELQRVAKAEVAEQRFNSALVDAQTDMRPVSADAENPSTRSKYASYAKLDNALRPIYTKVGFSLSFDTGKADQPDYVRVVCYLAHRDGHKRTYHVDMPADGKGAKGGDVMTKTHAVGAGLSYGQRYLLKGIFNVAVGEYDRDGNDPKQTTLEEPKGFQDWLADMDITAEQGTATLQATWKESRVDYRTYLIATQPERWTAIKAKAKQHDAEGGQ